MQKVRLEDVSERESSNLAQKDVESATGVYPVYGASGHIGNARFYHQEEEYIAVVKDGAGVGRTMFLPAKSSVIGTMQYIIPKGSIIPKYLYYAVKNMKLERYYNGATIPHIYYKDYKKETFCLPDMHEQQKVVCILEKVEEMIEEQQQILYDLNTLIKSRFVEMFGDTVTNSLNWEEHYLDEYIEFLTSGSRGWTQYFVDEKNELFITIKNVKNNHISLNEIQYINAPDNKEAERTKVKAGDLLISITADLGRTGVVDEEIADKGAYINQHLSLVRLDQKKVNPLYISHFLETDGGKRQFESKNQNGVKAGLNFDAIKSLKILVPPLERQNEYLNFVHQTDKLKVAKQRELEKTQILFDSLMQQYFG